MHVGRSDDNKRIVYPRKSSTSAQSDMLRTRTNRRDVTSASGLLSALRFCSVSTIILSWTTVAHGCLCPVFICIKRPRVPAWMTWHAQPSVSDDCALNRRWKQKLASLHLCTLTLVLIVLNFLFTEGWPGWVDTMGWLYTDISSQTVI